jgi:hypothetical protein
MGMLAALVVQMVMLVGMNVIVLMDVSVFVGVGNTIVGVLMGMIVGMFVVVVMTAHVIVIEMHRKAPLRFFFYYIRK